MGREVESPPRGCVLIVGDPAGPLADLGDWLRRDGHEAVFAAGVVSAREVLAERPPDLVVVDLAVAAPGTGAETALPPCPLRQDSGLAGASVLATDSRTPSRDPSELLSAGADDVLPAPFSTAETRARVRAYLALGSLRRSLEERVRERTEELAALRARLIERFAEQLESLKRERLEENRFHYLALATRDAIYDWDLQSGHVWRNEAYRDLSPPGEPMGEDKDWWEHHVHPDDRQRVMASLRAAFAEGRSFWSGDYRFDRGNGEYASVIDRGYVLYEAGGRPARMIGAITDITPHLRAEEALREGEERYRTLVEHAPEAIVVLDVEEGRFTDANENAVRLFGIPRERLLQLGVQDVSPPVQPDGKSSHAAAREVIQAAVEGQAPVFEWIHRNAEGRDIACEVRLVRLQASGRVLIRGSVTDITDRKLAEERLSFLAHHDVLTGLPNRQLLHDRLKSALADADRGPHKVGVVLLDLDHFKNINDSLGHATGDLLLREVGQRLNQCVRGSDTVARLSGDEFAIVLPCIRRGGDVAYVARKVLGSFSQPFRIADHQLYASASMGLTLYPDDGPDIDGLLRNADVAMYRAKELGRNTYQFYAAEMTVRAQERLTLEHDLRRALEQGEFELFYHPVVHLFEGEIAGAEALLRWHHPRRGWLTPTEFIRVAEETGLITPLGDWVLKTACAQLKHWKLAGLPPVCLGVNFSPRQFHHQGLVPRLLDTLAEHEVDPTKLVVEITESTLMQLDGRTEQQLDHLLQRGIRVALDDFGTGYSSLSHLKRFPISLLKIDRSFVAGIGRDRGDEAIIRALVVMARSLHIGVVAEGVETEEQLSFLRQHHCDKVQGFLFSRPLPADKFATLLGVPLRQLARVRGG
jgi:diguanylate cyclase (GGDEF)-like protein/PAS domain S-box-containing protein